ncbi:man(9)-alpha-mannosidase, putative [Ixodes scapularis]|uniref:alpha-1,2-Mannosidase n=1 Tax=Ixodes scapularis TaxID=6945 RepID=B7QCL8_IXOSC|nr:man(9)-alpha-mannosidase, putative [Ixodes scapularis]|eukprot:XP_002413282.1 man(9)-alpha-mannosidase, putative [Ixodes scapularis]
MPWWRRFRHAWQGYRTHAWGHDHLKPVSRSYHDWFGLGLTLVDALDTMFLMGLDSELAAAREWVAHSLNLNQQRDVNLFETTIRVLGALLSMHTLTQDQLYLDKAKDLGTRLLPGFGSRSGVPYSDVNLGTGRAHSPSWAPDSTVSEVSSLQLEFRTLSRLTGEDQFEYLALFSCYCTPREESTFLKKISPLSCGCSCSKQTRVRASCISAEGIGFSPVHLHRVSKPHLTTTLKDDYLEAVEGIRKHLVRYSEPNKLLFVGELLRGLTFSPKMGYSILFILMTKKFNRRGGMPKEHWDLALELMDTCLRMYAINPTFLSPEIAHFNLQPTGAKDILIKGNDAHNLLRPETLESLWYLYYFTRNETYRDWGWRIFQGFERHCKVRPCWLLSV